MQLLVVHTLLGSFLSEKLMRNLNAYLFKKYIYLLTERYDSVDVCSSGRTCGHS